MFNNESTHWIKVEAIIIDLIVASLIVLGLIYFCLLFADFIAPYTKDFSDRTMAYVPPSKVFTIDENGKLSKPYTYNYIREFDPVNLEIKYKLDRSQKHYIKFSENI